MKNKIKQKIKKTVLFCQNQDLEKLKGPLLGMLSVFLLVFLISFQSMAFEIDEMNFFENKPYINQELADEINELVGNYPIAQMVPFIAGKDTKTAAYLVAIAKKESNWGERAPVYKGEDCYNYWGYRGYSEKVGSGGHTCFDNPKEAVNVVSRRLRYLVHEKELDEPGELIVWKCGYSCAGHSDWSVNKWVSDVSFYYEKVLN